MMKGRVTLAGLGLLLAFHLQARALPPVPVHWAVTDLPKRPVLPGARFTLKLLGRIEPGWHLYAMEEPEGGPIATEIGLAEGDPLMLLNVEEPSPRMVPDPVSHRRIGMFQSEVAFALHLRFPRTVPAGGESRILVRYQSCNDQMCLPPRTETVTLPLSALRAP